MRKKQRETIKKRKNEIKIKITVIFYYFIIICYLLLSILMIFMPKNDCFNFLPDTLTTFRNKTKTVNIFERIGYILRGQKKT